MSRVTCHTHEHLAGVSGAGAWQSHGTHQYTYYLYYLRMWATGWLRSVGSLKSCVSFAKEPYKRDDILRKELVIFRSLLIVATPYLHYYLCYYRMYILLHHITTPCILPYLWREYHVPITGLIVGVFRNRRDMNTYE